MRILGIESSCDETAASVVENGTTILSNVVVSQIDIFKAYGGVIPEVAARSHLEAILPVIEKALKDANCTWDNIDAIAVTHTPGLLGSLLIGTLTARTLAILHKKPLYAVHHLKSHIYANWLTKGNDKSDKSFSKHMHEFPSGFNDSLSEVRNKVAESFSSETNLIGALPDRTVVKTRRDEKIAKKKSLSNLSLEPPSFPLISLVISGGHTQIIYMREHNHFEIIGTTHDDAVGECFDKVAKILSLPYPGGPEISKLAKKGDSHKYHLPHPKTENPLDFSFSGLKTAVLRAVQKEVGVGLDYPSKDLKNLLTDRQKADFAASFEETACEILLEKLKIALKEHPEAKSLVFAGGVSANKLLREKALNMFETDDTKMSTWEGPESLQGVARDIRKDGMSRRTSQEAFCVKTHLSDLPEFSSAKKDGLELYFPDLTLSGDNGAMVAAAAFFEISSKKEPADPYSLNIAPRSKIS